MTSLPQSHVVSVFFGVFEIKAKTFLLIDRYFIDIIKIITDLFAIKILYIQHSN